MRSSRIGWPSIPTCHSLRLLNVGNRPLRLLRAVGGLELVPLARPDECCGFGGTFSVKNLDVSAAMLADKLDNLAGRGAEFCVAADNSCLMHIGGGARRSGLAVGRSISQVLAAR